MSGRTNTRTVRRTEDWNEHVIYPFKTHTTSCHCSLFKIHVIDQLLLPMFNCSNMYIF